MVSAGRYVIGGTACGGPERCCRHAPLGCSITSPATVGCVSGAKTPGPCSKPAPKPPPPPPGPPPPPAQPLPELFSNVEGTSTAGQVYPNTLIDLPEQGRILVHASASTHQHGHGAIALRVAMCSTTSPIMHSSDWAASHRASADSI